MVIDFPSKSSRALDFSNIRERRRHPIEHGLPELGVRDLAAAEHHRHLHLVLLFQKPARVPRLGVEVVIVDPRSVLHFLELDHVLLLLRHSRLLRHFELVLPVVHDADYRRASSCSDFDQIQPKLFRHSQRGIDFENAQLRTVGTDHADRTDANLTVDPHALRCVLNTEIPRREKTKNADPC